MSVRTSTPSAPPRGLLDWLTAPSPTEELRFLSDDDVWHGHTYEELARRALSTAAQLCDRGLRPGETVVIVHRTGPRFVSSFFGTLAAGGTPSPLAPPTGFGNTSSWATHAAHVMAAAGAACVLTDPEMVEIASRATGRPVFCPAEDDRDFVPRPPAELGILQFTSGSRGLVRGVRVSRGNLETNLDMIRRWIRLGEVAGTSWLPLHHDMGLVGGLLTPLISQATLQLMRPEQFVKNPSRWLRQYDGGRGELMVLPNFGFEYVARRVRPEDLEGLDLSALRVIITGAERVRMESLSAFHRLLEPHGLRAQALKPAYGLAEATLAVTGVPHDKTPRAVALAPGPIRLGEPLDLSGVTLVTEVPEDHGFDPGSWHVSCGEPLGGLTVEVVDDLGTPLPDGHAGEIAVRGPSVALGYTVAQEDQCTRFEDGTLFTGDAGFSIDGDLYVLGRIGDSLQVRGRNVYVEDLEQALAERGMLRWHRSVVLAGYLGDVPSVWIVTAIPTSSELAEQTVETVAAIVGAEVAVHMVKVPAAAIELTSSGKPRRRRMWQRVLAGELTGVELAGTDLSGVRL